MNTPSPSWSEYPVLPLARELGEMASDFLRRQFNAETARADFNAAWDAEMRARQERIWADDQVIYEGKLLWPPTTKRS